MSGLAGLYNIPSIDPELSTWNFVHMAHHRDINRVIFELVGLTLNEFSLDPFYPQVSDDYLHNHQEMHRQMNLLLGIEGFNLLEVDMTKQDQFANWVFLNAEEHYQASAILGLG